MMKLCDNNEGLHFFGVSFTRHTFFKGVLKMKRLLSLLLVFVIFFTFSSCKNEDTSSNYDVENVEVLCSNCNAKINSTDKFCSECGFAVKDTATINSSENMEQNESNISTTSNSNHTHDYGNAVITKKPTCTEQGIKTFYCSSCSGTKAEYIDATGHKWQEATCASPKKCSICNITEGEKLEHTYAGNNCTICGKEKISFSYETTNFPVRIIEPNEDQKRKVDLVNAKCYIKEEEIYINLLFDIEASEYRARRCIYVKLVSSQGKICARYTMNPYDWYAFPSGENVQWRFQNSSYDFYKLEPDTYQVVISLH